MTSVPCEHASGLLLDLLHPNHVHLVDAIQELLQFPIKEFLDGPHECEWGKHAESLDVQQQQKHCLLSKLDRAYCPQIV